MDDEGHDTIVERCEWQELPNYFHRRSEILRQLEGFIPSGALPLDASIDIYDPQSNARVRVNCAAEVYGTPRISSASLTYQKDRLNEAALTHIRTVLHRNGYTLQSNHSS